MNSEISRKNTAIKHGLLESATWKEINNYNSEISRKNIKH